MKRGFYHKELPVGCLKVNIANVHKQEKELKFKRNKKTFSISLAYATKKKYTRNAKEAESSVKANKKIKTELSGYVIEKLAKGETCLLVRSAGVYQKRDSG